MKLRIFSLPVQFSSSTCLSNYLIDSTSDISLVWDGSPLEEGIFDSCSISFTPVGSSETVCVEVESFHIEDCNVNVNYRDYLLSTEVRLLFYLFVCLFQHNWGKMRCLQFWIMYIRMIIVFGKSRLMNFVAYPYLEMTAFTRWFRVLLNHHCFYPILSIHSIHSKTIAYHIVFNFGKLPYLIIREYIKEGFSNSLFKCTLFNYTSNRH